MKRYLFAILVLSLILSGCSAFVALRPTATLVPSPDPEPTKTPISEPTSTFVPSPSPTLGFSTNNIRTFVVLDGFSISVPVSLVYQSQGNMVLIADEQKVLSISFIGDNTYDGVQPLSKIVDLYLASLEKRGGNFIKGQPVDIQIDSVTGIAVDLSGSFGGIPVRGRAIVVSPRSHFLLFGLGLSKTDTDKTSWENKGYAFFEDLVDSIKFIDVTAACPVSTDKAYGYKEETPIKVGGGDFGGPSRERAYLDHLRGPNGEALSYERYGSTEIGQIILDIYHVTGKGVDVILYVDEYNYSESQAPVGFTCNGVFPLSAP